MTSLWDAKRKRQGNEKLDREPGDDTGARMNESGNIAASLRTKLEAAFRPTELMIEDESARHAGHAGARPGGETHFRVRIVSREFTGLSRVERQRRVYEAVSKEIRAGLHALALITLTPDEADAKPRGGQEA